MVTDVFVVHEHCQRSYHSGRMWLWAVSGHLPVDHYLVVVGLSPPYRTPWECRWELSISPYAGSHSSFKDSKLISKRSDPCCSFLKVHANFCNSEAIDNCSRKCCKFQFIFGYMKYFAVQSRTQSPQTIWSAGHRLVTSR